MVRSPLPPWTGAAPVPRGRTVQQSATGSQRYSSSVSPSSRGRSWWVQWKSSWSTRVSVRVLRVVVMTSRSQEKRTVLVLCLWQVASMAETTARVLQLLGLLQSRPVWTGPELADRLGVTVRSVRRDVERLRDLGYPVLASKGVGGGYQLGAGRSLPPLLLDSEEAVAVAVCLRLAAGGTVAGVGEAALRTLTKLDQVLPRTAPGRRWPRSRRPPSPSTAAPTPSTPRC